MAILVIDSEAKLKIARLRAQAEAIPLTAEFMIAKSQGFDSSDYRSRAAEMEQFTSNCTIYIEHNHSVAFTVEHQPFGMSRHISVAVERKGVVPSPPALEILMEEFGFKLPLNQCQVYTENFAPDMYAVNVIEPLEPSAEYLEKMRPSRTLRQYVDHR